MLPSGLQVVTEEMSSSRAFCVGFFARVGSRQESSRLHGASHFLEHVLFKGTPRRTAEEISYAVESVGGELNAYTAKEHTCFHARVMADDAELVVDVLSDMITDSLLLGRDIDAERDVIMDEIAMHHDDPGEVAGDLVTSAIFGDHGLGRPVIGSARSITALRRNQVDAYWRRHYRAGEIVVAAAGSVDHDRLVEQLGSFAAFGDQARSPRRVPRPSAPTVARGGPRVVSAVRDSAQVSAILAAGCPGMFDDRRYALGLLSLVLGGGMSSRLFLEVRERRGLAYSIEAGESVYSDAGLFSIDWQCAPERLTEILGVVRRVTGELAETGLAERELAQAKTQLRGQTILGYEGPNSRMSRLGGSAVSGEDRPLEEHLARYDAVTAEQVQEMAQQLFAAGPVLGVVGPKVARRPLESILDRW
ncbi:pitrilysin family protein [Microlunatus aurantiacus]|uniref:Pitrilysin family protein n=1 Tax=Microlunatus aurantiacus TaxID=446786 RepID=A0ABP7E525_9ACTN